MSSSEFVRIKRVLHTKRGVTVLFRVGVCVCFGPVWCSRVRALRWRPLVALGVGVALAKYLVESMM